MFPSAPFLAGGALFFERVLVVFFIYVLKSKKIFLRCVKKNRPQRDTNQKPQMFDRERVFLFGVSTRHSIPHLNNNNTKRQKKRRREKNASLRIWASLELVDDGNRTRRRRRKSERERRTCRGTRDFSGPSAAETEEGRKMRKETMARRHRIRKEKERETWSNSISPLRRAFSLSIYLSLFCTPAPTRDARIARDENGSDE